MKVEELVEHIPTWVYQLLFVVVATNFAAVGSLATSIIKFIIDFRLVKQDVTLLKQENLDLKKDLDAAHEKIRDLSCKTCLGPNKTD